MAIYHLSAKIHSRNSGKSIVAAAAYRAGQVWWKSRPASPTTTPARRESSTARSWRPEGAPDWVHDRLALWNAVEAVEKRKDAQLAREVEVGLPVELSDDGAAGTAARVCETRIRLARHGRRLLDSSG